MFTLSQHLRKCHCFYFSLLLFSEPKTKIWPHSGPQINISCRWSEVLASHRQFFCIIWALLMFSDHHRKKKTMHFTFKINNITCLTMALKLNLWNWESQLIPCTIQRAGSVHHDLQCSFEKEMTKKRVILNKSDWMEKYFHMFPFSAKICQCQINFTC